MTGVGVVGVPRTERSRLAAAVGGAVRDRVDATDRCVLVDVDLAAGPGVEERDLLADLAQARVPTALVATGADRHHDWPRLADRIRAGLDPRRRLAVFAVSLDTGDGFDELRRWCASVGADESVPDAQPTAVCALAAPERRARPAPPTRADRLAGVRAGVAAARIDVVTGARESFGSLAVTADRLCERLSRRDVDAYTNWLRAAVAAVDTAAHRVASDRLHRVRAVAGLGDGPHPSDRPAQVHTDLPTPTGASRSDSALALVLGATAGFGVGRVLVAPMAEWAGTGWIGTAATVLTGLAVAAWLVGVRRAAALRTELRRWTADVVSLQRGVLEHRLAALCGAVEAEATRLR